MSPYLSILVVCGIWTAMPQLRDDPIPLRREFAPPPSDSVQRVRMPRQVFEQLVQRAATNQERPPARIATAAYRATLTADGLTGSADWSLVGEPNQSIRFDEWRIAINKPRGGAILDASGLTLTQPQPTLQFDWSTRGIEEPSQLRIALEFPAAPIATLELDLPHDRIPHVSAGLLSGPVPFNATRSRWRLAFGGIPKVELTLARPTAPTSRPFTIGTRRTRYDFSPGIAMIAIEFDLAVFREPITQWECELPPNLSLLTVTGPQVARWRIEATKLVVDFRELNTTTKLSIQGVSPTPTDGQPWNAPRLEPTSMSLTADSIDVTVPSDLVVESVVAPDYRLVRTTSTAERGMTSNYVATLANDTPIRRRSLQFKLRVSPVEFRVHESLDWQLDGTRQQLVGRFKVTVVRGLVARLLVAIPPGFTPLNASMTPADPALTWQPHGTDHWLFEPSRPLNAGETYDIRIDLRKPPPKLQRQSLPVPPLSIVGAAEQHGEYRVTVSTPFRGTIPGEVTDNDGTIWLNTKTVNRSALALDLPSEPVSPSTSIPSARPVPEWLLNDVQQTTSIDADRQRTVTLTGRIVSSVSPRMTVHLPAEASVDFAMMNGKYADPLVSKFDSHTQATIAVPSIRDGVTFRLQYRLPSVSGLWPDVSRDSPKLPGDPPILHLWSAPTFRIWPLVANTMAERIRLIPTSHVDIVSWSLGVLIGAGIVTFVRYIWRRRRGLQVGIVAGVISSTVLGSPAQAPAPITVYCTREHNTSIVYVPQSVLDRLQSIATPLAPVVRWTSAEYRGVAHDTTVSFDAQWTIELGRSGTQNINLPLTGVRLESLTLDGRRAFPIAAANETYTLTVEGVGVHQVSAKFIVPAVAVGNDREFRFGIPAIPTATLRFVGPTIGRVRALERLGILHDGGPETRVELGAVTTIALRWRASREFLGGPAVSVREANVWEITESSLRLTTALLYRVDRGTLSRVAIEIPPGVEPGRIVVRPLDQGSVKSSVTSSVNGVRGWRFTPSAENWQRLQIELQAPTDGRFVVVLECVPRGVFGSRPSLCVPRSLDSLGTTCDIGVRVGGVMVERWENQGVIDYPADAVVRDWIDVPELPLDAPLTRSFRREGSVIPLTRPTLRVGGS